MALLDQGRGGKGFLTLQGSPVPFKTIWQPTRLSQPMGKVVLLHTACGTDPCMTDALPPTCMHTLGMPTRLHFCLIRLHAWSLPETLSGQTLTDKSGSLPQTPGLMHDVKRLPYGHCSKCMVSMVQE